MAKNTVPVYSMKAESLGDRKYILFYVTEKRGRELLNECKANRVSKKQEPLKIQLIQLVTPDINSPCSIGFKEVQANVGLGSDGYVKRVREKVEMWNVVSNPRLTANAEKSAFMVSVRTLDELVRCGDEG